MVCGPLAYPGWCCYAAFSPCFRPKEEFSTHLVHIIDEREHGSSIAVHNEGAVKLVGPECGLLYGNGSIWRAQLGRRAQTAEIFAAGVERLELGDRRRIAGWGGKAHDGCQNGCGQDWKEMHLE